jgi:hypothetical protein
VSKTPNKSQQLRKVKSIIRGSPQSKPGMMQKKDLLLLDPEGPANSLFSVGGLYHRVKN